MQFEFDNDKSQSNKLKHGIDFVETQKLWQDPDRVEIPAKFVDEPRYVIIAKINDKHWSAIFTYRHKNIRIISARRSRQNEKEIYASARIG